MRAYDKYWLVTLGRGALAFGAGCAIVLLPPIFGSPLKALLLLPFIISTCLLGIALYGLLDSALVITTGLLISPIRPAHWLLILQGLVSALLLSLIALGPFADVTLQLVLVFAAFQALCTALSDALAAVQRRDQHESVAWLLFCSGISLVSAIALMFAASLEPIDIARLVYGYLLLLGTSFIALSIRMLVRGSGRHQSYDDVAPKTDLKTPLRPVA